ncbi:carboxylating nicotinate-nucleotide diphosphorylase, partial [bacterium]|nr:carboxylating nicotinate-nucleotide diphosphorylase [bacterium]
DAMIRLDMSEYMEKHTVSRIVGSPPGYVGFEEGGQLTEKVRRKPYSVILFDEIEKAHPDVFNILLQILEDGILTDSQGRKVDFKNTVVIMTSNIGARLITDKKTSFGFSSATDAEEALESDVKNQVLEELKRHFKPEFLNRVDDTIVFSKLGFEDIKKISENMLANLKRRLSALEIEAEFDTSAIEAIANAGFDKVYGARPLRRAIQSKIEDALSEKMLDGSIKKGDKIADLEGPAKYLLMGERVALNYIQRMSGIATETRKYQDAVKPYAAKVVDTRKTTPNFRSFEKYSVKIGGGALHRFNLSDCAMIKDNHIRLAGFITNAVQKLRKAISFTHKIEVECDTLEQVKEAVEVGADIIMLDNMSIEDMIKAVKYIDKKAIVEASGNVNLQTVNSIASTGVDIISSSAIVAKAPTLDLALDM